MIQGPPLLECRNVRVNFGGVAAVDDVALAVGADEVVGLVGPNGSGKSTLLNALSGLVSARGEMWVAGEPVRLNRPGEIARRRVARTYQSAQVSPTLTCLENVLVASPDKGGRGAVGAWLMRPSMLARERARWDEAGEVLRRVGLLSRAQEPASVLPYGARRNLEIARALAARPKLILMDEPAAGLSSAEADRLVDVLGQLASEGIGLLVIEHRIALLERLCHRIVVLQTGRKIASGTAGEVWNDPTVMTAYLGEAR